MVSVRSDFAAWNPLMFVSVAFSSSTMNFSPLSGVTRFIVNRIPSAFRRSIRMARKFRNSSVDMARMTSADSSADYGNAPDAGPASEVELVR